MPTSSRTARRRVPVPRWAWGLVVLVLVLETVGLLVRLEGAERRMLLLSMDAPGSLARTTVAALFAAAAVVSATGAVRYPGRRTWWTAVAGVTALVAAVKAGGDVHVWAMTRIDGYAHPVRGLLVSGLVAGAVLVALFALSGGDRRDRRRVLTWIGWYAVASGGLSIASAVLAGLHPVAGTLATWVEESGEAVAAVGVLVTVVLGVAPRRVLPARWVLDRSEDVLSTVEQPEPRGAVSW